MNPLCEDCYQEGIVEAACEVHHVVPCESATTVEQMQMLMFNINNLASLCHACHSMRHAAMRSHSKKAVQENKQKQVERFKEKYF